MAKQGPTEVRVSHAGGGIKAEKNTKFAAISPDLMMALAEHFADGAKKYEDNEDGLPNFWNGYPFTSNIEALFRHLYAWLSGEALIQQTPDGEDDDPTAGNHHLLAIIWHAMDLWMKENGPDYEKWDDRPTTALAKLRENQTNG